MLDRLSWNINSTENVCIVVLFVCPSFQNFGPLHTCDIQRVSSEPQWGSYASQHTYCSTQYLLYLLPSAQLLHQHSSTFATAVLLQAFLWGKMCSSSDPPHATIFAQKCLIHSVLTLQVPKSCSTDQHSFPFICPLFPFSQVSTATWEPVFAS